MTIISSTEQKMLQTIRTRADELAHLIQEANTAGFTITFNINATIGACDVFQVFKMTPVDLKMDAN